MILIIIIIKIIIIITIIVIIIIIMIMIIIITIKQIVMCYYYHYYCYCHYHDYYAGAPRVPTVGARRALWISAARGGGGGEIQTPRLVRTRECPSKGQESLQRCGSLLQL